MAAPSSAPRRAAICSGVVPQQPPKIMTPEASMSGTSAVNCSGVQSYTALPAAMVGMPGVGLGDQGDAGVLPQTAELGQHLVRPRPSS